MSKLLVTEADAKHLFSCLPESSDRTEVDGAALPAYRALARRGLLNMYRDTDFDWWVTTDKGRRALVFFVRGVSAC